MSHDRRSTRLKGYDYTLPGAYFVTAVIRAQDVMLGEAIGEEMKLSQLGHIVLEAWKDLPRHFPHMELGEFIVMPKHVHGIIILTDDSTIDINRRGGSETRPYNTRPYIRHGLPEIVRAFKSFSARRINAILGTPGGSIWQRNYYEHIVRNQFELEQITAYIQANPSNWLSDREYLGLDR